MIMSEIKKNELEANLGWEVYTDPICTSVAEVVRSNIGKRILRLIIEMDNTHEDTGWLINHSDLIDKLFNKSRQLSLDDALYLLREINYRVRLKKDSIEGKELRFDYYNKAYVAKMIFSKIIIQWRAKHNLDEHIWKLWGINSKWNHTYQNYVDEIYRSIYANFSDRPDELAQLPWNEKYTNIDGTFYIGKKEDLTIVDNIPYSEEFSSDRVEANVLISKEFWNSIILLNKWEDKEQQVKVPHLVGKVIDRTWNCLILQLKDWKYLIYNHKDGKIIHNELTRISKVVENKIFIQEQEASYKLIDLTNDTIIKQFSKTQFLQSNYLDQVTIPKNICDEVSLIGFMREDGYFIFDIYNWAAYVDIKIKYTELIKKIMRKGERVTKERVYSIDLSQFS